MNAQQLRNSILQEAIEGRLVPQDPNDEPASVLLERIREEKKRLVKEGKLKKKDLEETPISEDEKPFEIPESWEWVRLGMYLALTDGEFNLNKGLHYPEGIKWFEYYLRIRDTIDLKIPKIISEEDSTTKEISEKIGDPLLDK